MKYKITFKSQKGELEQTSVEGMPCECKSLPGVELFYFSGKEFLKQSMPSITEDDYKFPFVISDVKNGFRLSRGKTLKQALSYLDRRADKIKKDLGVA